MKFEFNWTNDLWENYDLIYRWDSNISDLAERSKVNLDLWNLFIAIVSIDLTYQVRIMTGFNSIQKINFSKKIPI